MKKYFIYLFIKFCTIFYLEGDLPYSLEGLPNFQVWHVFSAAGSSASESCHFERGQSEAMEHRRRIELEDKAKVVSD